MREKKVFAERTKLFSKDKTIRKYFLVYEGSSTEVLYFNAINYMRDDIGINSLIELIPIIRSYSEEGWSNPKKILDRLVKNLEESKTNCISYETLLNRIMDYFYETKIIKNNKIQAKIIWDKICKICEQKLEKSLNSDVEDIQNDCISILKLLMQEYKLPNILSDISNVIKQSDLTYAEGFDKICIIIDRDKKSLISSQYDYIVNKCNEKGFGLYVTNPCFEFWLFLHFDEVFNLDKDKLLENPKVASKKRYIEQELCKVFVGYKKSYYNTKQLINNIDKAIKHEKKYCEDIILLKDKVGSNIGILIEELREKT